MGPQRGGTPIGETAPPDFDKAEAARSSRGGTAKRFVAREGAGGSAWRSKRDPFGSQGPQAFPSICSPPPAARSPCSRSTPRSSGISPICFAWLGLALFIDGIDGTLARAAKVHETAAAIDGVVLDLVVDFLTYVLVPVVALWRSDLMPTEASFWIGLVVMIASALYFADTRMKTDDLWFRGFPATWNILALYLFVLRPPWGGERRGPARRGGG